MLPLFADDDPGDASDAEPAAGETAEAPAAPALPFVVKVVRSARRQKTIGARMTGGVLVVTIPSWATGEQEDQWVDEMVTRMRRRAATSPIDLVARARTLAGRYNLQLPASIRWVDNQASRWGSCTPADRTVRVSSRLAELPGWVVDAVIVHELAHLDEAHHNDRFWSIVDRYPLAERARGYLMAKGLDEDAD